MTDEEREKLYEAGKAKLAEVAPRARAEAIRSLDAMDASMLAALSQYGQAGLAGLTEDAIESLMIYEDGPGRWFADVGIIPRFEGQPSLLGTPEDTPLPSQELAEKQGYALLCMLFEKAISQERELEKQIKKDIANSQIFTFGDVGMGIPQRMIDDVLESLEQSPDIVRKQILDEAELKLEETIIETAGNEIMTMAALEAASPEVKHRLAMLASLMIIQGKPKYTPGVGQPRM